MTAVPKPYRLAGANPAPAPDGRPDAAREIRSNEVEPRVTVTAIRAVPPPRPTTASGPAATEKSPRGPMRETSSSRSWYGSGSVAVAQPSLPRYWRASLTSAGVRAGRLA